MRHFSWFFLGVIVVCLGLGNSEKALAYGPNDYFVVANGSFNVNLEQSTGTANQCLISRNSPKNTCTVVFSWQIVSTDQYSGTPDTSRTIVVDGLNIGNATRSGVGSHSVSVELPTGTWNYRLDNTKNFGTHSGTITVVYPEYQPPFDSNSTTHNFIEGDFDGNGDMDTYHQPKSKGVEGGILPTVLTNEINANLHKSWTTSHPDIPNILDWSAESYAAFAANLNTSPGDEMLLLGGKEIILLHGDIVTPIVLYNDVRNAIISWDANGIASYSTFDFDADPEQYKVYFGDFNGDGLKEIILQGKSKGSSLTILNGNGSVRQTLHNGYKGLDWSAAAYDLVIDDINADGLDDIQMISKVAGVPDNFAYSNVGGLIDHVDTAYHRSEDPKTATLVGTTGGEFNVNESGAATYTIPLTTPQGTAGVAPQISLNYSSQSGNGSLGIGWGISGLSAIHRCPQNYEQNDTIKGVTNTAADKFCISGQQLFQKKTSQTYGGNNVEYQTELFSNNTITSFDTDNNVSNGPEYFTVKTRDGDIHYYGKHNSESTNALVIASHNSANNSWLLERTVDLAGNYIQYQYAKSSNGSEHYIDKISYGGNSLYNFAHYNSIDFIYAKELNSQFERSDQTHGYHAGSKVSMTQLLKQIKVYSDNNHVKTYQIYHQVSKLGEFNQVKAIQECTYLGNCYSPVTFNWSDVASDSYTQSSHTFYQVPDAGFVKAIDIDGDGRSNLLVWKNNKLYRSSGYGTEFNTYEDMSAAEFLSIKPIDLDADGKMDIVRKKGSAWAGLIYNKNSGRFASTNLSIPGTIESDELFVVDLDGDGRQDLLDLGSQTWHRQEKKVTSTEHCNFDGCTTIVNTDYFSEDHFVSFSSGTPASGGMNIVVLRNISEGTRFSDFNGDGVTDLIIESNNVVWEDRDTTSSSGVFAYTFNKDSKQFEPYGKLGTSLIKSVTPFDINRDGLTDVLYVLNGKWYYRLNHGGEQGLGAETYTGIVAATDESDNNRAVILDYDGDGQAEFWAYKESPYLGYYVYAFDGNSFKYIKRISGFETDPVNVYMDIKGNGNFDLLSRGINGSSWKKWEAPESNSANTKKANLITSITTGYGVTTNIVYKPLTNTLVYSNSATKPDFPAIQITTPMSVVAKVESETATYDSNSNEQTVSVSYKYEDFQAHLTGRGILGFKKLTTTDEQSGIITTTEYRQDFPFIGSPKKTTRKLSNGTVISEAVNHWEQTTKQGLIFPYLAKSVEKNWSLSSDGTPSNLLDNPREFINQIITTNVEYDDYGNLTKSEILNTNSQAENGSGGSQWFETKTVSDFGSTTWEQKYARLKSVTVTKTRSDVSGSVIDSSQFEYFAEAASHDGAQFSGYPGMLKSEVSFPGNNKQLKKIYAYDKFGNKTKTINEAKARNAKTLAFDAAVSQRSTITSFDSKGRFVTSIKNDLGHEEIYTYDARFGGVLTQTGPNGLSTHFKYDETGMKYESKAVNGTYSRSYLYLCGIGGASCPDSAEYYSETKAYDTAGNMMSGYAREFFNKLGQKVVSTKQTFGNKELVTRIEYDKFARVKKGYHPMFGNVDSVSLHYTEAKYDALGRVYQETAPGSRVTTKSYNGLTTVTTNAIGQTVSETKNINGDLLSVTNNAGKTMTYTYDGRGQFIQLKDSLNNVIINTIDAVGHKTQTNDPDKGIWTYSYNGFGELIRQQDARGVVIIQHYDQLGRMIKRVDNAAVTNANGTAHASVSGIDVQTTCWQYDTAALGNTGNSVKGALHSVSLYQGEIDCANPGTAIALQQKISGYDHLARAETSTQKLKTENSNVIETYLVMNSYDNDTGRIDFTILPEEVSVKNHYDDYGNLIKVTDAADTTKVYQNINDIDKFGNIVDQTIGYGSGAVSSNRSYNATTGYLESIIVGPNSNQLVNFSQGFDKIGNVISRTDHIANRNEVFGYAESSQTNLLNRLTSFTVNNTTTKTYSYDELGRMKSKSDMGDDYRYAEGGAGLHAVSSIYNNSVKKRSFTYDASGNLINDVDLANSANNREIRYAAFEKLVYIKKGSSNANEISFRYGTGRERYRRIDNVYENGQPITVETTYLGSYEKVVHTGGAKNGDVEHKYYIAGVALRIDTDKADGSSQSKTRYMHKDHLGSVIAISDESGNAVKRFRYDPFGKQYEVASLSPFSESAVMSKLAITDLGFTGHEMLSSVDIIHMNGRIYDANIGRFLQADAYIQAPKNMQNMDRYSYVLNNPLSYTDPSGHFFKNLNKFWKQALAVVATVVIAVVLGPWAAQGFWNAVAVGALAGAANGAIMTGTLRGAVTGAVAGGISGGVFYGIGTAFKNCQSCLAKAGEGAMGTSFTSRAFTGKVAAHAITGGIMSKLQGGKFGYGFASAGVTQAFSGVIDGVDQGNSFSIQRISAAALLGGTASSLSGGKFVNGAVTAAFSRAFNDEFHHIPLSEHEESYPFGVDEEYIFDSKMSDDTWELKQISLGKFRWAIGREGEDKVWDWLEHELGHEVYRDEIRVFRGNKLRKYDGAFRPAGGGDDDWILLEIKTNTSPLIKSQIQFDQLTVTSGFDLVQRGPHLYTRNKYEVMLVRALLPPQGD
ncbi:SpvB/TcaC N-terminal domain-containing protein [Aliikangiella maris]|uniref:SpvB/TcaC N-terminal domain-containing protein n=2 Tax=Aliikangiella maris TaxID=3162458 RepID=A0ABV2BZJ3_9GAMM